MDNRRLLTGIRAALRLAYPEQPRAPDGSDIRSIAAQIDRMGEKAEKLCAAAMPAENIDEAIQMMIRTKT